MKPKKQIIIPLSKHSVANPPYWYDTYGGHFSTKEYESFENSQLDFMMDISNEYALLRNRVFQPPFDIKTPYRGRSCAGFNIYITLPNGEPYSAQIKLQEFAALLKDNIVSNQIICPLTFVKRGTVYLLVKA